MKFVLQAKTNIKLPEHAESTLRGGFGKTLYNLACINDSSDCKDCRLRNECAYFQVFNPRLSEREKLHTTNRFKKKIRPYILQKNSAQKKYKPGDKIEFNFKLFGNSIKYIPYIIQSWAKLEDKGIGAGRGKFKLKEIWQLNEVKGKSKRIYDEFDTNIDIKEDLKIKYEDIKEKYNNWQDEIFTINLDSPTLLMVDDEKVEEITFYDFMRNLFRRLSGLSKLYGKKLELNFDRMLEKAKKIKIVEDNTDWEKWQRYSNRQDKEITMEGAKGQITYKGDIQEFLPYIKAGEQIAIGKNTVFGLGQYQLLSKPH